MSTSADPLIAIDVLLEPDQTMIGKSRAVNARLRGNYPGGYELDATHAPHVTLLQRFVRAKDLDAVTAAITKVLGAEHPTELQLKAKGLEYAIWSGLAVTAVVVERTPELMRLHQKVVDAVAPFSVSGGDAKAFVGADANPETIRCAETFIPKSSGDDYIPHVTVGVAPEPFVKGLKAEPFQVFGLGRPSRSGSPHIVAAGTGRWGMARVPGPRVAVRSRRGRTGRRATVRSPELPMPPRPMGHRPSRTRRDDAPLSFERRPLPESVPRGRSRPGVASRANSGVVSSAPRAGWPFPR